MLSVIKKWFSKPVFFEHEMFGNTISSNVDKDTILKSIDQGKIVTVIFSYNTKHRLAKFYPGKLWSEHGENILRNRKNIRVIV